MTIRLSFLGGAEEVGRSAILVSSDRAKILLDAGIKIEGPDQYPVITEKDVKELDGVFITHAHLDHSGFIPHLFARGYRGKVYVTKTTMELLAVQIADYMRLSEPKEITKEALALMQKSFSIIEFRQPLQVRDMKVEFLDAGHIVGSAFITVQAGDKKLLYTGDINLAKSKLLDGADLKDLRADALITESTYGGDDDVHLQEKEMVKGMVKSIKETILRGGKVIIPSFGVERGQEVLLYLDDFMNSGTLPKVPIYVDGVIGKVMRIFRHNVIYCRKEIQSKILMSDYDPFKSDNFIFVESKVQRKKIIDGDESCVIVTTAGMLTGGPVVGYLKGLAGNSANKLILVGWQPEGSSGRKLLEGQKEIDFHGSKLKVNLEVEMHKMSGHADRNQLELLPKKIQGLKEIFIVHGEKKKQEALKRALEKSYKVVIPKIGESFVLGSGSQQPQPSQQSVQPSQPHQQRQPRQQQVQQQPQKQQRRPQLQQPQQHQQPQPQKPRRQLQQPAATATRPAQPHPDQQQQRQNRPHLQQQPQQHQQPQRQAQAQAQQKQQPQSSPQPGKEQKPGQQPPQQRRRHRRQRRGSHGLSQSHSLL